MLKWLALTGGAYLVLTVAVFLGQRRLLYLPTAAPPDPSQIAIRGLAPWPDDTDYRGLVSRQDQAPRGTVIVFHGNAGAAIDRSYYLRALMPLGHRVLLAEYPGYGGRPGKPGECVLVDDARRTVRLARQAFGAPLYVWGESLGAGVIAAAVAADPELPIDGLVLLTPWASLADLAQSIYWFLPARWLLLDRYDNAANLAGFSGRKAVLIAERDEVIPPRHSRRLYELLPAEKKRWLFAGAGHNSWPVTAGQSWWREVSDYLSGDASSGGSKTSMQP